MILGLVNFLETNSVIAALIAGRITPGVLPEAPVLPALTYMQVGGTLGRTLGGRSLQEVRLQLDCWGTQYSDAYALSQALLNQLDGFSGAFSDGTQIQTASYIQSIDDFEHDAEDYRIITEVYLYFL